MTRRSAVFVVAGVVLVALLAVAALFPVPYVVFSPGPVEDTLADVDGVPVIAVEGARTYATEGRLDLTTVGVTSADARLDLVSALAAWAAPDQAVLPRRLVYPDGTTTEDSRARNADLLDRSEEAAKVAALRELGRTVPETVVVDAVLDGSPAEGALEPGDAVVAVDGRPVASPAEVRDAVVDRDVGAEVTLTLRRGGDEMDVTLTTVAADDETGRPVVGFTPAQGFLLPVEIEITIDERIGGPSAGTVFALAIYDLLTPGALLGGLHVAGTGEISPDGEVGAISGIQQKIAAAGDEGAELFLAPYANCPEVAGADPRDMRVVPVKTLGDAITAVETMVAGDVQDLPGCPADG